MNSSATFAPLSSDIPAPSRGTDVFDFLHIPEKKRAAEDRITVNKNEAGDLVAVTIETADGRSLSRRVPAESWSEKSYRRSLIRSMRTLVA